MYRLGILTTALTRRILESYFVITSGLKMERLILKLVGFRSIEGENWIYVKNTLDEEPPTGMEGCTPGYWRQPQHFGNWVNYKITCDC